MYILTNINPNPNHRKRNIKPNKKDPRNGNGNGNRHGHYTNLMYWEIKTRCHLEINLEKTRTYHCTYSTALFILRQITNARQSTLESEE